jgi:Tfp pilus assembly protein PilF
MRPETKRVLLSSTGFGVLGCCLLLLCSVGMCAQGTEARMPGSPVRPHSWALTDTLADAGLPPDAQPPSAPRTDSISVRDFKIPPAAMKEFRRSEKCIDSKDYPGAIEHLQKALRIEPDFVQAHNNLGATYLEMEKFQEAIDEFQKAIDLDPKMEAPYRNMSVGLFELGRYPEAETAARQAIALRPQHTAARYTLGRALAAQGSTSAEAERLLRGALPEFPLAHLSLAQVLLNRCQGDEAAAELRTYLASGPIDPETRKSVEVWLDRASRGQVRKSCDAAKPSA